MHFYVFEDAMNLHILLSYTTSEQLGILQFNVPNLAAHTHIDAVSLLTPRWLEEDHKDEEDGQLQGPPNNTNSPATLQSFPLSCDSGKRKTAKMKKMASFKDPLTTQIPQP